MNFRERYRYDPSKDKLGSGGFATVFKAHDVLLDRDVALKIFHTTENIKVNLLSELQRMSKLDHPNLIRCIDILNIEHTNIHGLPEQLSIGVMEYASGGSLKDYIHNKASLEEIKKLLIQILRGLSYLHSKGIIHRDLKSQNILLTEYEGELIPKITDFGISKSLTNDGVSSSVVMGTIEYMAPEQFNPQRYGINGRISTNLDLWSFGILAYEAVTKKNLFGDGGRNSSSEQVMNAILSFSLPGDIEKISEPFQSVIKICLVSDANMRVKEAKDLIPLLQKLEQDFTRPPKKDYEGETKVIRDRENIEINQLAQPQEIKPVQVIPSIQQKESPLLPLRPEKPAQSATSYPPKGEVISPDFPDEKKAKKKQFILASISLFVILVVCYFIFKPGVKTGNTRIENNATYTDSGSAWLIKLNELKKQNPIDSVKLFNLSMVCALKGIAECQYQYGILLNAYGRSKEGFEMLTNATGQNHVKATSELAYMYYDGVANVVEPNKIKARTLYEKAAAANNSVALLMMGIIYKQGQGGLPKDEMKANNYFRQVVKLNDNPAAVLRAKQEVTGN